MPKEVEETDRKMIFKCLECGNEQIGYSSIDGKRCTKCKGCITPIRYADKGGERVIEKANVGI